ncbi:uncharacterized protein [Ptychodera flava]|uniref:uncharacterized protein n=1 Tax=Ptychodera flava TaxID=63121 RepID=UPI00396A9601
MGDLAKDTRRVMENQLHVYGALPFRGLPLESGNDFSRFMKRLGYTLMDYEEGNYIRDTIAEHVLTASNEPPEFTIDFHSELAFLENFAMKIFFYCDLPPLPGHGGESIIADTRDILKKLHPDFNKLRKLGVLYIQRLPRIGDGNLVGWEELRIIWTTIRDGMDPNSSNGFHQCDMWWHCTTASGVSDLCKPTDNA